MAKQPPSSAKPVSPSPGIDREPDSAAGLLSRLMGEVSTLFRKEIALAKAEVSEAASEAKAGAISLVAGGLIIFAAVLVLLAGIVLLLAEVMEAWLAALIVAAVVAIIGFVLIQSGKKKLDPASFKPERTQDALRKDKEMVQRRAS
jgi:ABC-type long-subunit fatty acid transport system fused permease/ATPase subunit